MSRPRTQPPVPDSPWDDLMLYRKRIKQGRVGAFSTRVSRPGQPKPRRIIAVFRHDGSLMDEDDYDRFPFFYSNYSTGCVHFRDPTYTGGLTVIFE